MALPGLTAQLRETAKAYPAAMVPEQLADVPRIAYHIELALGGRTPGETSVCDVGGGVGLFSMGCAAAGFKRVVLIDDFRDEVNRAAGESILDLHRKRGIEVLSRDVIAQGLGADGPFDAVTSFDSMEHWHHSPKRLFRQIMESLRPGGLFVLGVPNSVNLRKRLTVPLGRGKWSRMADWYEPEVFRGHVREPDVDDLRYIGRDLGLISTRVIGRNWLGLISSNPLMRLATTIADRPMRLFPSLCSDIYLVGEKPAR